MCCGVPLDLYDVVVLGGGPGAFAAAFAAREAGRTVAVVLAERRLDARLAAAMARFEITLIEGWPEREDEHYLDVAGRLVYGDRVVDTRTGHDGRAEDRPKSTSRRREAIELSRNRPAVGPGAAGRVLRGPWQYTA